MRSPSRPSATPAFTHTIWVVVLFATLGLLLEATAVPASAQARPKKGGSLTALEASVFSGAWNTLDPATDTNSSTNPTILNAIYGGLFLQRPGGALEGDLASGYKLTNNGMTADIYLRRGVTFQDGTPFNASAVAYNINRYFEPQYTCICTAVMPISSVTTAGPYTVVLNLKTPYAPIFAEFLGDNPNWIVSPTALAKMGEAKFGLTPVGAGPFEVVSDTPNVAVKLRRNPHYWQKGRPYLNSLTFQSIGTDSSAVDALQAGQAQVYENINPVLLTPSQARQLTDCNPPPVTLEYIEFNTLAPPFNNILAREAISYATNPKPILRALYENKGKLTESGTAPAGEFYQPHVPGYRAYNLARARALVKQLGGLHVKLTTVSSTLDDETMTALQSQWAHAGISTTLDEGTLTHLVQEIRNNTFEFFLGSMGAYDPAAVPGIQFHFSSAFDHGASGVNDPHLDALFSKADAALTYAGRFAIYKQIYEYMAQKAYGVFLFSEPSAVIKTHNVRGLPCSSLLGSIHWDSVWIAKS